MLEYRATNLAQSNSWQFHQQYVVVDPVESLWKICVNCINHQAGVQRCLSLNTPARHPVSLNSSFRRALLTISISSQSLSCIHEGLLSDAGFVHPGSKVLWHLKKKINFIACYIVITIPANYVTNLINIQRVGTPFFVLSHGPNGFQD